MISEFIKSGKIESVNFNDLPMGRLAEIINHICPEYIGIVVMKNWEGDVIIIHKENHLDRAALSGWDGTEYNCKTVFPKCLVRILGPDESVVLRNN